MWPGTRSKRANPPAIRRRRTLPLTCCDNQRRILRQLRLAQQGRKLQGRPQGKKSGSSAAPRCLEKRPQPSLKNRGRHSNAPSRGDDDWRLSQRTWLLPVPKGRMGRPAGARCSCCSSCSARPPAPGRCPATRRSARSRPPTARRCRWTPTASRSATRARSTASPTRASRCSAARRTTGSACRARPRLAPQQRRRCRQLTVASLLLRGSCPH